MQTEKSLITKVIDILSEREYSFSELLNYLRTIEGIELTKKELEEIISKIVRISKRKDWKLYYKPTKCKKCNNEIKNFLPISKCPKCKSEWLEEVSYFIKIEK